MSEKYPDPFEAQWKGDVVKSVTPDGQGGFNIEIDKEALMKKPLSEVMVDIERPPQLWPITEVTKLKVAEDECFVLQMPDAYLRQADNIEMHQMIGVVKKHLGTNRVFVMSDAVKMTVVKSEGHCFLCNGIGYLVGGAKCDACEFWVKKEG